MNVSRETSFCGVSRETELRLHQYADLLHAWNPRINLVGDATKAEVQSRHIGDSLRLLPLMPAATTVAVDLGSGAGFPGLIVAIATGIHVHLIEADHRKAAFLREAARVTQARVTIHTARIEDRPCPPASLIMSRAMAPLPRLLELAHPLLASGGICLFHKGRNVQTELTAARKDWNMVAECFPSALDPSSVILCVSKVARV